jgi:hypothetical protein
MITIHKDKRNKGKSHYKNPYKTGSAFTKLTVMKEITKYIEGHNDFGQFNYMCCESRVITKLDPYTTYVYEDLY